LSARVDIKDVANILLKRTVETLGAAQGNMIIFATADEAQQNFEVSISAPSKTEQVTLSDDLLKHITESREGLVIENAQDSPFWKPDQNSNIRSALIAPLNGRKELLGVLTLTHEQEKYFNFDHLLLLQAIASQAAIAAENARLYSRVAQEQKRLAALLQHAAEAILMFDAQGRLTLLNPAGEKLFTDFKANLNQPLPAGHGYDVFVKMLEDARLSKASRSGEVVWPDQRTFVALITPIEDSGQVAILHDVTRFKDLDQVKNEFIATASHDLKNPITTIAGFSTLLGQAGPLNEQQKDFVSRIQSAAQNMSELVQNMVSLAQIDLQATQKHQALELGALLTEMIDEFVPQAVAKNQTLQFHSLTTPVQVNGDSLQLKQLFRNLIGNAIKYSPESGRIMVATKIEKENIQVDVQDTGFGIPAADLPYIFDRFYRVRSGKVSEIEGNGLGLAIVKSIVEQHGGQVNVQSEVDKGTCFSVSLSLMRPN